MRLLVAALLTVLVSGCTPTPAEVASPVTSGSPMAQPTCKLFVLRGVKFPGCAENVIRVTDVADRWDAPPRYEISETGKDYAPYDPKAFQAPVGFDIVFKEECKGCGVAWQVKVHIETRLSKLLTACLGGMIDITSCISLGDLESLGEEFKVSLRHNGEGEYLYVYFSKQA